MANGVLSAERFDAGFARGDTCYNALHRAADGQIYFAIGSWRSDTAARLFRFDEASHNIASVADFGSAAGASPSEFIPHGKVHVDFAEAPPLLFLATHIGYYDSRHRLERPGRIRGLRPYPGGAFVAFDPGASSFRFLGSAPEEEGIIAMASDLPRGYLYGLTWPGGLLLRCDMGSGTVRSFGPVFGKGERGATFDRSWNSICRSLALEPASGDVYWSDTRGNIHVFRRNSEQIQLARAGALAPDGRPSMWRKAFWHSKQGAFWGILRHPPRLFRFDPASNQTDFFSSLQPEAFHGARRWQPLPQATLALRLSDDGDTIRYLSTDPGIIQSGGRHVRATVSYFSYRISSGAVRCHGVLRLADGRYPTAAQSLLVSGEFVYTVAWMELPVCASSGEVRDLRKQRCELQTPQLHGAIEELNLLRFRDPIGKGGVECTEPDSPVTSFPA